MTSIQKNRARRLHLALLTAALAASSLAACSDSPVEFGDGDAIVSRGPHDATLYGAAVAVGEGRARTYITLAGGVPVEVGVAISELAMQTLPGGHDHGDGPHAHYARFDLRMHPQNPTPYRFVELDWNPNGHEPPGIYDLPHFDFHFYTTSVEERDAIVPTDPQYGAKAGSFPAEAFRPQGFLPTSMVLGVDPALAAVPEMGMHWHDLASPELNGQPFTKTFLYGSWDGKMTFVEPMVTRSYLESKPDVTTPIGQADRASPAGHYPSSYRVYWDEGRREYRVALSGFSWKN